MEALGYGNEVPEVAKLHHMLPERLIDINYGYLALGVLDCLEDGSHFRDLSAVSASSRMRPEPTEGMPHGARQWVERVPRLSPGLQYTAAVAVAIVAVALRLVLDPVWGAKYPFIFIESLAAPGSSDCARLPTALIRGCFNFRPPFRGRWMSKRPGYCRVAIGVSITV
jgi:hypothetical protein